MSKLIRAFDIAKNLMIPAPESINGSDKIFLGTWLTKQEYAEFLANASKHGISTLTDQAISYNSEIFSRAEMIELATTLLVLSREMGKEEHV